MIKAILTDIEGTTSSLSFVKDVLFPYARARLPGFVRAHLGDPQVACILQDARQTCGGSLDDEALIAAMLAWIDADRKITALKALQGLIWEDGYRQGAFTGHVYPDAVTHLQKWHQQGLALYVYSSGSVYAQKLLFGHSDAGDLTPLFSGYFDTNTGDKRETASYLRIAAAIGQAPEQILFLSDIKEELDAAQAAGFQTCWLVRGQPPQANAEHRQAENFKSIPLD
jgi:enolase-phosphatase E1